MTTLQSTRREARHPGHRSASAVPGAGDYVEAATHIVRDEGLQAFTMRRLAEVMGRSPMAVYRHFPSKADLFAAVIDRAWQDALAAIDLHDELEPSEAIVASLMDVRRSLVAQGELAVLVATPPRMTAALKELLERSHQRLADAGFPDADLIGIQQILARLTATSAVHAGAGKMVERLSGPNGDAHADPLELRAYEADPASHLPRDSGEILFERTIRFVLRGLYDSYGITAGPAATARPDTAD